MFTHVLDSTVMEHCVKEKRLTFEISITGNATAANKKHYTDLPGTANLRTEGLTSTVDALDATISWTTADDESSGNSVFGVFLLGANVVSGPRASIKKVLKVDVQESSTSTSTALAVTKHGTGGLSTDGNIAFTISATGTRLDTESPKITVDVSFLEEST